MSREAYPLHKKNRVSKAGDNIRNNSASDEDVEVIENWRASHTHILNTFQATLRKWAKGKGVIVAQRLKRRSTIYDKLQRQSGMELSRMHDIAGCRLIFKNIKALKKFRKIYTEVSLSISHNLILINIII